MKMREFIIQENDANQRLDKFISKAIPLLPKGLMYKSIRNKKIKVNRKRCEISTRLNVGDVVHCFIAEEFFEDSKSLDFLQVPADLKVVYEDDDVIVIDKPHGLLSHKDSKEIQDNAQDRLLHYLYLKNKQTEVSFTPAFVHRLDRNTSGLVIFGKTFSALKDLNEMVRLRHCIKKEYQTIVSGQLTKDGHLVGYMKKDENKQLCYMVSKTTPGALTMETKYRVLKSNRLFSYIEVELVTGRTHQIRLHMASTNHPVIGDRKYGNFEVNKMVKNKYGLNHQLLHAYRITFVKPIGSLKYLENKIIESRAT